MNFRFTKWKTISSLVIDVLIWVVIFLISMISIAASVNPPLYLRIIIKFLEIHNMTLASSGIFSLGNIFLFIVYFAVIYVIWSLFQRKSDLGNFKNS